MKVVLIDADDLPVAQLARTLREFAAALEGGEFVADTITDSDPRWVGLVSGHWRAAEAGVSLCNARRDPAEEDEAAASRP